MAARYRVRLTEAALADLRAIAEYRAERRGWDDADEWIGRLREHVRALDQFPLRGAVPKELAATGATEIRQTVLSRCRIFYRVADEDVAVFMFVDGVRNIALLLRERLKSPGLFELSA